MRNSMLDFFQDLRTEYNQKIRIFRSSIDDAFSGEDRSAMQSQSQSLSDDQSVEKIDSIAQAGKNDIMTEEQRKMQLYGSFIQYHTDNLKNRGKELSDLLKNTFDSYFFMMVKRDSIFTNPLNEVKFQIDDDDLHDLKRSMHPATISALSYKGQTLTLYYAMQKVLGRLSSGEAILFQKELMDSYQTEGEVADESIGNSSRRDKNIYTYEKNGSDTYFKWGESDIVNKLEVIMKNQQNMEKGDDYFVVTVDGINREINVLGSFNEFIMVPVLQHYTNILGQINQGNLSDIFRNNLVT